MENETTGLSFVDYLLNYVFSCTPLFVIPFVQDWEKQKVLFRQFPEVWFLDLLQLAII